MCLMVQEINILHVFRLLDVYDVSYLLLTLIFYYAIVHENLLTINTAAYKNTTKS